MRVGMHAPSSLIVQLYRAGVMLCSAAQAEDKAPYEHLDCAQLIGSVCCCCRLGAAGWAGGWWQLLLSARLGSLRQR